MERQRLESWKEIASYIGRDVRTVIRWEQARGLPVHRFPGPGGRRVYAYADELDAWLNRADGTGGQENGDPAGHSEGTRHWDWKRATWIAVITGALTVGAAVVGWLSRAAAPLHRVVLAHDALVGEDGAGRPLWTSPFAPYQIVAGADRWQQIVDLDADGRPSVLALIERRRSVSNQAGGGTLVKLSAEGHRQWEFSADDHLAFRAGPFEPPWSAADFDIIGSGGEARVVVALHHFTWWPALLVTLDAATGRRMGTFVHSGWIQSVVSSADGRHLFIAGVANSRQCYFLAILDARRPSGHSPEPPGAATECSNCPEGDPLAYFVFPRTDVGQLEPFPQGGPTIETLADGTMQIQTKESQSPNVAATIIGFTRDFTPSTAQLSDSFWEWHRRLELEGKLSHGAEACPSRGSFDVQRWSRDTGWRTLRLVPKQAGAS